jgi:Tfp pilus assembly protein PilO
MKEYANNLEGIALFAFDRFREVMHQGAKNEEEKNHNQGMRQAYKTVVCKIIGLNPFAADIDQIKRRLDEVFGFRIGGGK